MTGTHRRTLLPCDNRRAFDRGSSYITIPPPTTCLTFILHSPLLMRISPFPHPPPPPPPPPPVSRVFHFLFSPTCVQELLLRRWKNGVSPPILFFVLRPRNRVNSMRFRDGLVSELGRRVIISVLSFFSFDLTYLQPPLHGSLRYSAPLVPRNPLFTRSLDRPRRVLLNSNGFSPDAVFFSGWTLGVQPAPKRVGVVLLTRELPDAWGNTR